MKNYTALLLSILFVLVLYINQSHGDENKAIILKDSTTIVYYFHSNIRCETCNKLEKFTIEAVKKHFSKEIDESRIELKIINIDEVENERFIKKYDLYMQTLILSKIIDGKEIKYEILDQIWDLVGNKEKYFLYIKNEINDFLKIKR